MCCNHSNYSSFNDRNDFYYDDNNYEFGNKNNNNNFGGGYNICVLKCCVNCYQQNEDYCNEKPNCGCKNERPNHDCRCEKPKKENRCCFWFRCC